MDDEKVNEATRYAHDTGFDEGYEVGYEEGFRDGSESQSEKVKDCPCNL